MVLATPRNAFIKNTANLNNPREMHAKNIEALKILVEFAQTEGNHLKKPWKDVLLCISQMDRLELISGGVNQVKRALCHNYVFRAQFIVDCRYCA